MTNVAETERKTVKSYNPTVTNAYLEQSNPSPRQAKLG